MCSTKLKLLFKYVASMLVSDHYTNLVIEIKNSAINRNLKQF